MPLGGRSTFRVTVAVADLVLSATDVALTVTVCELVTEVGAVYRPVVEIAPTVGEIVHVTCVLPEPETVAVNCCAIFAFKLALPGLTETLTACTVAVKLAVWLPPLMVTAVLAGVKVNPVLLGVTV
jgi:hypothetical protein